MTELHAIEIKGLTKKFDDLIAVNQVSLSIKESELFGLLGPNGAGKSTLISMLCCQILPDEGTAHVLGHNIVKDAKEIKKVIGVCPQESILYDDLTAQENLTFFGDLYRVPRHELKKRVFNLLELMQLSERAQDKVGTFSGGMKQRLNISAALLHDPKVLFLDEPTIGLDPQARHVIWDLIEGLKKEGKTILMTTHYMEEADRLSDRVAIMDFGKIIAFGTPDKLKTILKEANVVEMVCRDFSEKTIKAIRKLDSVLKVSTTENVIKAIVKNADEALPDIVSVGIKHRVKVERIDVKEPTLEDVFIHLTGRTLREG